MAIIQEKGKPLHKIKAHCNSRFFLLQECPKSDIQELGCPAWSSRSHGLGQTLLEKRARRGQCQQLSHWKRLCLIVHHWFDWGLQSHSPSMNTLPQEASRRPEKKQQGREIHGQVLEQQRRKAQVTSHFRPEL